MKTTLVIICLAMVCQGEEPPSPVLVLRPPVSRTFWATSYADNVESGPSETVTSTNYFPLTVSLSPPPMLVDGFFLYMSNRLGRVQVFDLGTNMSYRIAPTNVPTPPFNLVISVAAVSFTVTNHDEAQRFYRAVVQTSTNLVAWETFSELTNTTIRTALK